jgi:hypothetical protein
MQADNIYCSFAVALMQESYEKSIKGLGDFKTVGRLPLWSFWR